MVLVTVALLWMLFYYIPHHLKIFKSLGAHLPLITVAMISLSQLIQNNWYYVIPVLMAGIVIIPVTTTGHDRGFVLLAASWILLFGLLTGIAYLAVQIPLRELQRYVRGPE